MSESSGGTAPTTPTFAIIALIAGIIAFVFGWVAFLSLLIGAAAIVFAVLALQRNQSKGMSITGLVLGALGALTSLIAGIVLSVGIGLVGSSTSLDSSTLENGQESSSETTESSAPEGSRENPYPFGTMISDDSWDIQLVSFNPDANGIVSEANMFNSTPAAGKQYVLLEVSATYKGADEGFSGLVRVDYVSSTGEVISSWDSIVVGVDPQFGSANLYAGGTDLGKIVFEVPSPVEGLIRVESGFDEAFFSLP